MSEKNPKPRKSNESLYNRDIVRKLTAYNKSKEDTYEEQIDYIDSYINSPMYKKRLVNVLSKDVDNSGNFLNPMAQEVGAKKGENVLNVAKRIIAMQNKSIQDASYNISNSLHYGAAGQSVPTFDKNKNFINSVVSVLPREVDELKSTVAHEASHASTTNLNPYSSVFAKKYVSSRIKNPFDGFDKSWFNYASQPTELKARIDGVRYILNKSGIYDAGKEEFNESHYRKINDILKNPSSYDLSPSDIRDLKNLTMDAGGSGKENFIWLMNNIAKNKSNTDNSGLS